MYFFYNITVYIASFTLKIVGLFNKKINFFIKGRKNIFKELNDNINSGDRIIWFHCASLGEFEQGRPIIERVKSRFPDFKVLVTFFSPSGYEVRKDYTVADLVSYLPLDTSKNAKRFLKIVNPEIAIFIKYEFWPNLLKQLKEHKIKTILVSGIFRRKQSFFKTYGSWMKKSLNTFNHFFVQDKNSQELLKLIGFTNSTISGDTRFDRVFDITKQDNTLNFVEKFKSNKITLVAGSTWPKDEKHLVDYINNRAESNQKFIIAPHNINESNIVKLKEDIFKETILYSEMNGKDLNKFQVLIIDTIGLLTKIYSYADIAYIGGGFGTGIHNILEPVTFGVPVIIGPNYHKFNEAKELINLEACIVISNSLDLQTTLSKLFNNDEDRINIGKIAKNYIINNIGATEEVIKYLGNNISIN